MQLGNTGPGHVGVRHAQLGGDLVGREDRFAPVPSDRHAGRFMAPGTTGAIIVDGLMLMERPRVLGEEARAEELYKARRQVTDNRDQLSARTSERMPDGYSTDHRDVNTYRGARTNSSIAPDPEAQRPRLPIDPDE